MIEISLAEGAGWSPPCRLTAGQAAAAASVKEVEHRSLASGEWQFQAHRQAPKVGAVRLGSGEDAVLFRISPKIPVARLMFMAGYAEQRASARWDDAGVPAREEEGLVAAVARAFGRAAQRALRHDVLLGLRDAGDEVAVIRAGGYGKDRPWQGPPPGVAFPVSYDDFTPDIPENRFLVAAARELRRLPGLRRDVRSMLDSVEQRLSGVGDIKPGENWVPSRLNANYYTALSLAGLVLRGNSYEMDGDTGVRADGLLISMPHLFQDFTGRALGSALRQYGGHLRLRQEHHLDDEGIIRAQTDAEYYAPGAPASPAAIIDAKYTVLGAKGRSGRVQQMISYCYMLGCPRGYLVYAQGPESAPVSHTVGGIVITEYPLSLDHPPKELLTQIDVLAAAIAQKPA